MTAPLIAGQARQLLAQRGHAWLLQGPSGLGQYSLALDLARAWLCEQPTTDCACGQCGSCHAIEVRTHADLERATRAPGGAIYGTSSNGARAAFLRPACICPEAPRAGVCKPRASASRRWPFPLAKFPPAFRRRSSARRPR